MTKRPPLAVIILVIIICFALGLLNVLLREPEDPSSLPTALPPSPFEAIDSSINSILIIGVDDLQNSTPRLRAIWIAAYRTHEDVIYLHGFPLDVMIPGEKDIKLNVLNNVLTISVETTDRKYYKEVKLPTEVEPKDAETSYKNGVLEVKLQKTRKRKPKGKLIKIE